MSFAIVINYGAGDVELTDYSGENLVYAGSLKRTQTVHNDKFRSVSSQAYFSFAPNTTLMAALFGLDRDQEITISITEDASPWFTGYVRPITKFKDAVSARNEVAVECVDVGWLLHHKPATTLKRANTDTMVVCDTTTTAVSMVHWLLSQAGFTGTVYAEDISTPITWFRSANKEYFEILDDLLFSYHRTFYFDAAGDFHVYNWGAEDADVTSTATIAEDNMIKQLTIDRSAKTIDTPAVKYFRQVSRANVVAGSSGECFIIGSDDMITATSGSVSWTPTNGANGTFDVVGTKTIYVKYDLPEECDGYSKSSIKIGTYPERYSTGFDYVSPGRHDIVSANPGNRFVALANVTGYTITNTIDTGTDIATSVFTNNLLDVNDECVKIEFVNAIITGIFTEEAGLAYGPDVGPGNETWVARYCYSYSVAETIATALSRNLENGEYKYTWTSQEDLTFGSYYTVNNDQANYSALCRIVKKTLKIDQAGNEFYEYEGRQYSGLGALNEDVDAGSSPVVVISEDDIDPAAIVGTTLDESTDIDGKKSGLYMFSDQMGFYDATLDEWMAYIKNDGTFRFDGDGSSYIAWDGSALTIAGDVVATGDSTLQGTITTGEGIASDNYVTGSVGWQIDGDGSAEFETLVVRNIDSSLLIDGDLTVTGALPATPGYHYGCLTEDASGSSVTVSAGTWSDSTGLYTLKLTDEATIDIRRSFSVPTTGGAGAARVDDTRRALRNNVTDLTLGAGYPGSFTATTPVTAAPDGRIICRSGDATGQLYVFSAFTGAYSEALDLSGSLGVGVAITDFTVTADGDLVAIDGDGDVAYVFDGISNSLATSFAITNAATSVTSDSANNLITMTGTTATVHDGLTASTTGTISLPANTSYICVDYFDDTLMSISATSGYLSIHVGLTSAIDSTLDTSFADISAFCAIDPTTGLIILAFQVLDGNLPDTTYHLFLVRKDSDGSISRMFDTSVTAANRPDGYTYYRRIRGYLTNSSANIIETIDMGMGRIDLETPVEDYTVTTMEVTQSDVPVSVPTGLSVVACGVAELYLNAAVNRFVTLGRTSQTLAAPDFSNCFLHTMTASRVSTVRYEIPTNASGEISYIASSAAATAFHFLTTGWHDYKIEQGV